MTRAGVATCAAAMFLVALGLLPGSRGLAAPSASALYREPLVSQVEISPSGAYVASIAKRRGVDRVVVRLRDDPREVRARERIVGVRRLTWIDDAHLAVHFGRDHNYLVVEVSAPAGRLSLQEARIHTPGYLVDALPGRGEEVLWARWTRGYSSVYRVSLSELLADDAPLSDAEDRRVARLFGKVDRWVADRDAVPRAALKLGRGSRASELWYRDSAEAEWRLLRKADEPEDIPMPLAMAENGRDLVVGSREGRDTRALVELSVATGEPGRELFADPDADIVGVMVDYDDAQVIGVVYEREGLPQFHHLDGFFDRYQRSLAHAFPGMVPIIVGVSRERRYLVVVATSPQDPGTYFVLDTRENTATPIARLMPWLDPQELAPVEALRVESRDGLEIEAFLTRPRGIAKPPLLVLPHGGPRDVRDTRGFDPLAQFLAGGGIAVLQVNYRGSAGRGQAFLDAGKREWAGGIEDDLEAAFDEVVRRGLVDGQRACIAGGSYGGYSALMSVIRSPERYRCAASLNGPTDLRFAYEFYFSAWDELETYFDEYIADPDDPEGLRALSPVYRASEIRVPVLLVQGSEDRRVDADHFHRMVAVLEALGRPHVAYLVPGMGHSPSRSEWISFAVRLRKFLSSHLGPL